MSEENRIIETVEHYYSGKLREHGATPQGVDWNSKESQFLRFAQLVKILPEEKGDFSLLDYGCGFGSLLDFLRQRGFTGKYTGLDVSDEMLAKGRDLYGEGETLNWISELSSSETFDFVVASGIFNVRLTHSDEEWEKYFHSTLDQIRFHCRKGFAFNVLTSYSDAEYMREYLFYADPSKIFDYCKRKYSKRVALLHDYPLYEFTVLVRLED
ncbi:MAG: class I SAM-dependent methyltransferase [Bdellovibrionales bacterium]|nr:class I SAM-dependent methyltransferase [Bdellovibrionales bacterium]